MRKPIIALEFVFSIIYICKMLTVGFPKKNRIQKITKFR